MAYEFNQESFQKFSEDVLAANGDQSLLTAALADMQMVMTEALATVTAATEQTQAAQEEATRLRESNMNLHRRIGEQALQLSGSIIQQGQGDIPHQQETPIHERGTAAYMERFFAQQKT